MSSDQPDFSVPTLGPISKESRWEWRSTIWNDNNVVAPNAPPNSQAQPNWKGKFFPRGCRGKIDHFEVYCRRTAAGVMYLNIAPVPCMGYAYQIQFAPAAGWTWVTVNFQIMWNYDSLFIWLTDCGADTSIGYDVTQPQDSHQSLDNGATWLREVRRYFIRAIYDAETSGDVPVSGTLNIIAMPSISAARGALGLNAPAGGTAYDAVQYGAGELLIATWEIWTAANFINLSPEIYCDGVSVMPYSRSFNGFYVGDYDIQCGPIYLSKYDAANGRYGFTVYVPYPFKRTLMIGIRNFDAVNPHGCFLGYCYKKIS